MIVTILSYTAAILAFAFIWFKVIPYIRYVGAVGVKNRKELHVGSCLDPLNHPSKK